MGFIRTAVRTERNLPVVEDLRNRRLCSDSGRIIYVVLAFLQIIQVVIAFHIKPVTV